MPAQTIFVTGANGDIARNVVTQALAQGKSVFATVRDDKHINTYSGHPNLSFLIMHVDDELSIRDAFAALDTKLNGRPLDAVIHCAAIENPCSIEFLSPADLERVLKVNTVGSLIVMQESFSRLRKSKGNLILASSLWGRVSGPLVGAYSASKWALESLADAARRETIKMGFSITLANIGTVRSRMLAAHISDVNALLDKAGEEEKRLYGKGYKAHADQSKQFDKVAIRVDKVAAKLLRIADSTNPAPRYKIGLDAKIVVALSQILSTKWMDRLLGI